tara:strand:+ start:1191 stop:1610 length:420 start_codon:yes stop_codon:yes gene_type:complete
MQQKENYIINILFYICNKIPISNNILGEWIKSFHFMSPYAIIFIILYGPILLVKLCCIFMLINIILFINMRGCYLSKLEKKLCNNNNNIVDIIIEIFQGKINNNNKIKLSNNRYYYTFRIGIIFFILVSICSYYRFYIK